MFSFWISIIAFTFLGLIAGIILGYAARRFATKSDPIVDTIDHVLPQSQCAQCGYPGCLPYAEAVANGDAINKCVPGGEPVMLKLAEIMAIDPQPMGQDPTNTIQEQHIVYIDEANCIGCTKCAKVCPVDAIIGAKRLMHTVVIDLCTGCDLCILPCPMDCIEKRPIALTPTNWKWDLHIPSNQAQASSHV